MALKEIHILVKVGKLFWIIWVSPKYNHKCLYKREIEVYLTTEEEEINGGSRHRMRHFEDGRSVHKPRNASGLWRLKKARKWILPSEAPEGTSPADTLALAQ